MVEDFVEKHCKPRQRTWSETRRILRTSAPRWLERPFRDITKSDAYDVLDGILAKDMHAKARVTLTWWRALWDWASRRELVAQAGSRPPLGLARR